jgi:uncharacterized protein YndB with AHSA1/START domain
MKLVMMALAAMLAAGPVWAEGKFPDVRDSSSVDAGGSRVLQLSIDLNAPPKAVWDAFTDAATVKRWTASLAIIDLKQGGSMEESYNPNAKPGDAENIRHQIIAYVPGQILVFRNTNAPRMLPGHDFYGRVVSILEVQDQGGGRSRLVLSQMGYAPGPEFDKLYAFFREDNAEELQALKTALESPTGKLHGLAQ